MTARERYTPLALWAVLILLTWGALQMVGFQNDTDDGFDRWLLFGVGVIVSLSALIMLVMTERWTMRSLGVFGLIVFDAMLYTIIGGRGILGFHVSQSELNVIRAVIIVSGPLLLISQLAYLVNRDPKREVIT